MTLSSIFCRARLRWARLSRPFLAVQCVCVRQCVRICPDHILLILCRITKLFGINFYHDGMVSNTTLGSAHQRSRSHIGVYFFTKLLVNIVLSVTFSDSRTTVSAWNVRGVSSLKINYNKNLWMFVSSIVSLHEMLLDHVFS